MPLGLAGERADLPFFSLMNLVPKKLCLVLLGVACVLAGCNKTPRRTPSETAPVMGSDTSSMHGPIDLTTNPGLDLTPRDPNIDGNKWRNQFEPVFFDFDQWDIKASERVKLQKVKEHLDKNPGDQIEFEGYCDWRGTAEYNLALGDRRAAAAKRYVQSLGVAPDRLLTNSKGSLEATKNADAAAMARDRRVEIVIIRANLAPAPSF